jgi:hypothetical protein
MFVFSGAFMEPPYSSHCSNARATTDLLDTGTFGRSTASVVWKELTRELKVNDEGDVETCLNLKWGSWHGAAGNASCFQKAVLCHRCSNVGGCKGMEDVGHDLQAIH